MPFHTRVNNILLWCTKSIIFLIPFLSLYIASSMMYPYVTGKNFAFRVLVEVASVFWLGLISTSRECRPSSSTMVLSVLVFTVIVGLADLFGVSPNNSFWSNYERMEGYITILHLTLFFMIVKSIFKTGKDWILFFSICLVVSMFVSLYTFIEPFLFEKTERYILEFGTRRAGTIGNPAFLASYLLFSVFIGLILIQMIRKKYLKLLCLLAVILNAIAIYITASRGAILAAFIGAVFLLFGKLRNLYMVSAKRVLLYMLGLVIFLSTVFLVYSNTELIKDGSTISRFRMMSLDDPAIKTRLEALEISWYGIKHKPFLGWGQENFISVYNLKPILYQAKFIWTDRAHNIIIHWLVNAGVLGLLSYFMIYGAAFYTLRNNFRNQLISNDQVLFIAGAIIVYFVQNLFTFDTINSYLIFFSLMAYIDNIESMNVQSKKIENTIHIKKAGLVSVAVTLFSLFAFVSISYFINYIPIKQLKLYSHISKNLSKYNSFSAMLNDFDKALSYRTFGDDYIRDEMTSVSHQIIDHQLYGKKDALKLIQRTTEEREKGLINNRYNLEYLMKTIRLYKLIAINEPSFITATETLIKNTRLLSPQFRGLDDIDVDLLIIKKEYERAFHTVQKIVESDPKNTNKLFKLALTAILTSRNTIANDALDKFIKIKSKKEKYRDLDRSLLFSLKELYQLAQAYMEVKNYNKALEYYKKIIEILPYEKDVQALSEENRLNVQAKFYYLIAMTYNMLGDKESAVKEAKKAAEIDPANFADRAKEFIE